MDEPLIVSVSGLRGVVGRTLDGEVVARYAAAFESTLPPGPVVIGRDGRESGPMLLEAIERRLTGLGRDVIDCGVAATPTVGLVVARESAAGGIQISASHNPARYNGLKLFSHEGRVLSAAGGRRVLDRFDHPPPGRPAVLLPPPGGVRRVDGADEHVRLVAATVDVAAIRAAAPLVWLDACHGAGSGVGRRLLEHLGCRLVLVGGSPDGRFEHEPEPTAANVAEMLPRIPEAGAAVGFFQDPDADRLAIATADGTYVGEEATLALAAARILPRREGPVVVNCSTSGMTARIARSLGRECLVSAVGEANVVAAMLRSGAALGGEGNGGVIDPRVGLVRDSFVAMAVVLDQMCAGPAGMLSVRELVDRLPRLVMHKAKLAVSPACSGARLQEAFDRIAAAFPEAAADRLDGLRLDWPDRWALVRASNTEPIVRVVAEVEGTGAEGAAAAAALCDAIGAVLAGG
jgi:phosphomannomutase